MGRFINYFCLSKPPFFACAVLSFGLAALVCYFFVDSLFLETVTPCLAHSTSLSLLKGTSLLLSPLLYVSLCLGGFLWVRFSKKSTKRAPLFFELLTAQIISAALVRVFKIVIGRARPEIFVTKGFLGFKRWNFDDHFHSFPSGHIAAAFTLAASMALCYPRFRILSLSLAAIFSLSRILLLAHFPSDLFATGCIVMLVAQMVHVVLESVHT